MNRQEAVSILNTIVPDGDELIFQDEYEALFDWAQYQRFIFKDYYTYEEFSKVMVF